MIIKVKGMKCDHCKKRVEESLLKVEGIKKVKIDLKTGKVQITSKEDIPFSQLKTIIEETGYEIEE